MACANASGSIAMPIMFIHKSAHPRCFKNLNKEDLPVHYYSQKNSWMDSTLFKSWFFDKFVPLCCSSLQKVGLAERALPLLKNSPCHPSLETVMTEDQQIRCIFLSPNTTSLTQPMDQGVLQNIKMLYCRDLLMKAVDREEEDDDVSFILLVKFLKIKYCVFMVTSAWENVCSKSTIGKSWKNLWPEAEDDVAEPDQSSQARSEVQGLLTNLGVEQDAGVEWLDGEADPGCQVLTEYDIVEQVLAETAGDDGGDNDDNDNEDPPKPVVSHGEACRALETLLQYADQQEDILVTTTVLLYSLHSQVSRKRRSTLQQKISDFFSS